MGFILHI